MNVTNYQARTVCWHSQVLLGIQTNTLANSQAWWMQSVHDTCLQHHNQEKLSNRLSYLNTLHNLTSESSLTVNCMQNSGSVSCNYASCLRGFFLSKFINSWMCRWMCRRRCRWTCQNTSAICPRPAVRWSICRSVGPSAVRCPAGRLSVDSFSASPCLSTSLNQSLNQSQPICFNIDNII